MTRSRAARSTRPGSIARRRRSSPPSTDRSPRSLSSRPPQRLSRPPDLVRGPRPGAPIPGRRWAGGGSARELVAGPQQRRPPLAHRSDEAAPSRSTDNRLRCLRWDLAHAVWMSTVARRLRGRSSTRSAVWVHAGGRVFHFTNDQASPRARSGTSGHGLGAPMPATVRAVLVDVGAKVRAGDTVVTLEAMKMELSLRAPSDGTVTAIHCRVGELVEAGVPLVEIA